MPKKKPPKDAQEDVDAICKLLCDEARNHMKVRNYTKALQVYNKALELNPGDQNALVTRSKCYLLLGEPSKGLADAEEALAADPANIRAIYQKAEALYFLGRFEHSLMFFHRGLRLRPEMNMFRLGVQKSREAIEKTIGGFVPATAAGAAAQSTARSARSTATTLTATAATAAAQQRRGSAATATGASELTVRSAKTAQTLVSNSKQSTSGATRPAAAVAAASRDGPSAKSHRPRTAVPRLTAEQREAKRLLGELCVDKQYLQDLLRNPACRRVGGEVGGEATAGGGGGETPVTQLARDAVEFLNTRQEFWRQQRPCTAALPLLKKRLAETGGVLVTK